LTWDFPEENTCSMGNKTFVKAGGWLVVALSLASVRCSSGKSSSDSSAGGSSSGTGGIAGSGGAMGGNAGTGGGKGGNAGGAGAMGGTAGSGSGGHTGGGTGGHPGSGGAMGGSAGGGTGGHAGNSGETGGSGGGSGGTVSTGGTNPGGSGGSVNTGGSSGRGGTGGGNTSTGGGSGAGSGRVGGMCQAGTQYPAPTLTGTPKLLYKPSGSSSGTYEGPVWVQASNVLLFSDVTFTTPINPSQILKLTPPSTEATFLQDSGTNGMAIDGSGTVFACSHKVQGIVKLDVAAATLSTVVDNYNGKTFNSPNDIVVRSDGTLYFTDPDFQLGSRTSGTGKKGVYRVSPTAQVSLVDDTFAEPNGITLSPDESVLYVADYNGNVVRTFSVASDGSTSNRKDFVTVTSPDGFAVDCAGNLYVASGTPGAIQVYSPSGTKLGSVTVVASLSNLAFGGSDGKTLYITAGKALYSLDMNLPGYPY